MHLLMENVRSYIHLKNRGRWIIAYFGISLTLILVLSYLIFSILSSTRTFIGYHSIWTHTQNRAVIHLISYANNGDFEEFLNFEKNLTIMDGIQNALYELNMDEPDVNIVETNLLSASIYLDDVRQNISRLHFLRNFEKFANAFDAWEIYHQNVQELRALAITIRNRIETGVPDEAAKEELLLLARDLNVLHIDDQLELLSDLEHASSIVKNIFIFTLISLSLGLLFAGSIMVSNWEKNVEELEKVTDQKNRLASFPVLNPNPIIVLNKSASVTFTNQASVKLFKVEINDSKYHPVIRSIVEKSKPLLNETESTISFELSHQQKNYLVYGFIAPGKDHFHFYLLDITQKIQLENKLYQSLEEKTHLLAEVHHRVKNNLAIAIALLEIEMIEGTENSGDVLNKSITRLHSIAAIHRQLYDQENLTHIYLNTFFESVKEITVQQYEFERFGITLTKNCHHRVFNINQAVPCSMLLNELTGHICSAQANQMCNPELSLQVSCSDSKLSISLEILSDNTIFRIHSNTNYTLLEILKKQLSVDDFEWSEDAKKVHFDFKLTDIRGTSSALPKNYNPDLTPAF